MLCRMGMSGGLSVGRISRQCVMEQGFEEALLCGVGVGEGGLHPFTQGHEFIDLGYDAVLLGEGWEGEGQLSRFVGV